MGISVKELLKSTDYSAEALKAFGRVPLWKIDETTHSVYGLSTAQVVDADKEIANYPDSKRNYLKWGAGVGRSVAVTIDAASVEIRTPQGDTRYWGRDFVRGVNPWPSSELRRSSASPRPPQKT